MTSADRTVVALTSAFAAGCATLTAGLPRAVLVFVAVFAALIMLAATPETMA